MKLNGLEASNWQKKYNIYSSLAVTALGEF